MERVLIAEVLYPIGHKKLNENYVRCIAKNFNVTLVDDGEYFSENIKQEVNKIISYKPKKINRVEALITMCHVINLKFIARTAKKENIKTVILLSFHTESFSYVAKDFNGLNVIVVHHYEIDRMTKRVSEKKYFDKYKNNIFHVVLEEFIKDGFQTAFQVQPHRVFVANNPVSINNNNHNIDINCFISTGQATDEKLVKELIEYDKASNSNDYQKGNIIIRSKSTNYKGKHIEVFTGYLEREKYDALYENATACIVRYESTYTLRSSGSIDDAFRNKKKVIAMGFPAGISYSKMYPHNCIYCDDVKEIFSLLFGEIVEYDLEEGQLFERTHSLENVTSQWKNIIDNALR